MLCHAMDLERWRMNIASHVRLCSSKENEHQRNRHMCRVAHFNADFNDAQAASIPIKPSSFTNVGEVNGNVGIISFDLVECHTCNQSQWLDGQAESSYH